MDNNSDPLLQSPAESIDDIAERIRAKKLRGQQSAPIAAAPANQDPAPASPLDEISARIRSKYTEANPSEAAVTADTPWSEVLSRGAGNFLGDIPTTAVEIGQGLYGLGKAAMHPTETGKALANADWSAIGNQLKHDYLTEEGWKQGIANRPVSRLMDVSMLAAGPEAIAAKAATKVGATGLARGINIASKAHDPATWAVGTAKFGLDRATRLGNEVFGEATGTGGKSLNLLYNAGLESPDMAKAGVAGLRSKNDPIEAVQGFEAALDDIKTAGHTAYRADKAALSVDRQRLSFAPVDQAIANAHRDFIGVHPVNPNPDVMSVLQEATQLVNKQKRAAARYNVYGSQRTINPYLNPIGMDELKKALGRITAQHSGEAKAAAARIQAAVANEIKTNAPRYERMMADYSAMSDAIDAFKTELSLTKNPDAALRKLYSALRNNVTANYGRRWKLVEKLSKNPKARMALYNLAGQTNNKLGPRGLVGAFQTKIGVPATAYASLGSGAFTPWALPFIWGSQSPRIMGEIALASGRAGRNLARIPWRPIAYAGHAAASPYAQQALDYMDDEQQ